MSDPVARLTAALEGRYSIEGELGEGGMANVYLAKDLRHNRSVALKVLKPALAAMVGAERFLTEIETTANLQHPNILPLFDSGEADGFLFYVMPYVKGETVRDRLDRENQLPVDEAVRIVRDAAEALHAAHEQGVVHRDVKPENILLSQGRPLVADFGVALALRAAGGDRMTETGLSLGTPHYMSPEQATAENELTHRSDVYSLGAVLYEMLAGEPPHAGGSSQQVIMKVVTAEPHSITELRGSVPPNVADAVMKSLEKLAADRFGSAKAFSEALGDPNYRLTPRAGAVKDTNGAGGWKRVAVAATMAAVVLGLTNLWSWTRPGDSSGAVREWTLVLPELSRVSDAVLSPVGGRIAFIGDGQVWIRSLEDRIARPLPGTEGAVSPFWSRDGDWIGYFIGRDVFKVRAEGGAPVRVTQLGEACVASVACGGAWTDDGRMLLSTGLGGIVAVSEDGGEAAPFLDPGDAEHFHQVVSLPGGDAVLVQVDPDGEDGRIDVRSGDESRTLADNPLNAGNSAAYDPAGYVVFNRGGLWAVPFSLETGSTTGDPFIVRQNGSLPSVSNDGMLLFTVRPERTFQAVWVDGTGTVRDTVGSIRGEASQPAVSPDGQRVAMVAGGEIWIVDPSKGLRVPLGTGDRESAPTWSPVGEELFYQTVRQDLVDQESLLIRTSRPGGDPRDVVGAGFDPSVSDDGRYLVFSVGDVGEQNIQYIDLVESPGEPRDFAVSPAHEASPRLSPDGRHVAYIYGGYDDGRLEVYLSAFPDGGERHRVSDGTVGYAARIRWSPAGDRLYYERLADGALMEVEVDLSDGVTLSSPRALFNRSDIALDEGFDVSADGSRFLVIRTEVPYGGDQGGIVVVENWLEAFRPR
jgi:Tol biopolymer transport system component